MATSWRSAARTHAHRLTDPGAQRRTGPAQTDTHQQRHVAKQTHTNKQTHTEAQNTHERTHTNTQTHKCTQKRKHTRTRTHAHEHEHTHTDPFPTCVVPVCVFFFHLSPCRLGLHDDLPPSGVLLNRSLDRVRPPLHVGLLVSPAHHLVRPVSHDHEQARSGFHLQNKHASCVHMI